MKLSLPPAHRLARTNYVPRAAAFALAFLVLCALFAERGFAAWELAFAALSFLVYPHLVYLHARMVPDSKQAELNNLYLDSILMGIWAAQVHFALWPAATALAAVTLNNAANGGAWRLLWGTVCFAAAAAVWGAGFGYRFDPHTGAVVAVLSVLAIFVYVSWVGTILFVQNKVLLRTHHHLQDSEKQFHFVAEHPGDMVSVLDGQGRILYASSSHARHVDPNLAGTGSLWLGLVHPDDHQLAREFLERLAITQTRQRARLRMVPREGPPRLVECHGNPVQDHHGNMTAIVVVTRRADFDVVPTGQGPRGAARTA
jgi:PAS domain S-box-containing protein